MSDEKKPQIMALYLPQYHRIPENDKWWEPDFTDWLNVQKAKALFEGHLQPKVPLQGNYYDLTDIDVMRRQAELAANFGLGGFCFYHYWFEGKKLLEKPVEQYREDEKIKFPYCLCWANHTWLNSWGAPRLQDEIFIKQRYGNEQDWRKHFDYLQDFFHDEKYIKIKNKPIFLLFMPKDIPRIEKMVELWNLWAEEEGFSGIYFVQMWYDGRTDIYNARVDFEPLRSWKKADIGLSLSEAEVGVSDPLSVKDYDLIYAEILSRQYAKGDKCYYGAFPGWDNTPRKERWGTLIKGNTPVKFEGYLFELLKKSFLADNEMLLINAWNEWAEGAYLEPDEHNRYEYLQAIKNAGDRFTAWKAEAEREEISLLPPDPAKFAEENEEGAFSLVAKWLFGEVSGFYIRDFFVANGLYSIAIYGAGKLGMVLLKALENSPVKVSCIIDRKAADLEYRKGVKIITLAEVGELPPVDAIIVTVVKGFTDVYHDLRKAGIKAEIISISAIIESL